MRVHPRRAARWLLFGSLATAAGAALAAAPPDDWLARSRALADELTAELKAELGAALQTGGPVAAIEVCRTRAPMIAAKLSNESGAVVGRTALRLRNPANAPDEVSRALLQRFAADMPGGAGAPGAAPPEAALELRTADGVERRYLRAIALQPPCVACHGRVLAPEVREALANAYPQDAATGFDPGQLRGAVVVRWRAEE